MRAGGSGQEPQGLFAAVSPTGGPDPTEVSVMAKTTPYSTEQGDVSERLAGGAGKGGVPFALRPER